MITVYSKENCPNCDMAVRLLGIKGIERKVLKLGTDFEIADLYKATEAAGQPNPKQFPVIFKDSEFIGGFNDLRTAMVEGKV